MDVLSAALAHYRRRAQRARALERQAAILWARVDQADIAGSWAALMPQLLVTLTAMQAAEAAEADAYVALAMAEQSEAAAERIVPETWAGLASDGRPLDTLLMQPVITAKTALQSGRGLGLAMTAGQAALQMIVSTQVSDAGRTADQVAMLTHGSQGYIRMVVGDTCSRCVVLAGKWYRWNAGFDRHPRCDCIGIPAAEDRADDVRTEPNAYFRSLTRAEQDRVFGQAGAQAIRDGADMGQVVNARRGMYSAGGVKLTTTGTTRRGFYGGYRVADDGRLVRRPRGIKPPPRLMPEQIYKMAGADREKALSLLRENGYITDLRAVRGLDQPLAAATAHASAPAAAVKAKKTAATGIDPSVRPSLRDAKGIADVRKAFQKELGRITGYQIPVSMSGSVETAAEHAEGILRCLERFPKANLRYVAEFSPQSNPDQAESFAFVIGDQMRFNNRWTARPRRGEYQEALRDGTRGWDTTRMWYGEERPGYGFNPRNTDTALATAIHEFGHILDLPTLSRAIHDDVIELVNDAARDATREMAMRRLAAGLEGGWEITPSEVIREQVSGYAATNTHELIAEAFADVMVNGDRASQLSHGIFDLLAAEYDRRYA